MESTSETLYTVTLYSEQGDEKSQVADSFDALCAILSQHLTLGLVAARLEIITADSVGELSRLQISELVRELESRCYDGQYIDADERVEFADAFTQSLSWFASDAGEIRVAFWVNPRRFVLTHLNTEQITTTFEAFSWHDDSMTSGIWGDVYGLLCYEVSVTVRIEDDNGSYFSLQPAAVDPFDERARIVAIVSSMDLDGAQNNLLPLLLHGFPDGGLDETDVCMLPRTDNPGLLFTVCLNTTPEVELLLRESRAGQVSPSDASEWLQILSEHAPDVDYIEDDESELEWPDGHDWSLMMSYLQSRVTETE